MEHQFCVELASSYGIEEAIIIQNLYFWIRKNVANGSNFHDGRCWTYNSSKAFSVLFPYMTESKIYRILKSLEEKGIIIKGNYNENKYDRTCWYSFTDKAINELSLLNYNVNGFTTCNFQNKEDHFTKTENPCCENKEPIPYSNTDSKPNNKTLSPKNGIKQKRKCIPDYEFVAPEYKEILLDWLEYKRNRKQSYADEKSIKVCYNKLIKLSGNNSETARMIVEQSMANNWAGLFELKNENQYGISKKNYSRKQEANNYALQQFIEEGERIARGERVYTSDPNSKDNPF